LRKPTTPAGFWRAWMTPLRRMPVEAGVVEADGLPVVLDEGVHGGPPDHEWVLPSMIPEPIL
jgi:hypothetical protein